MHIGFISNEYPHPCCQRNGGIGTAIRNLAQGLVTKGHHCAVFVTSQDKNEILESHGITIIKVKYERRPLVNWILIRQKLKAVIRDYHQENPLDVLEVPDWCGLLAFVNTSIPRVVKIHGSDTYFCDLERRKLKLKNRLMEWVNIQRAQGVIAVSRFALEHSATLIEPLRKKKSVVFGNSVDLSLFKFTPQSESSCVEPRILYFGTIIRKKGVFELAKIFNLLLKKIPAAKLILMGRDSGDVKTGSKSTFEMMQKCLSEEAKCRTEYLGERAYEEALEDIRGATLCVFPSFAETFGNVNIEAMACGKVVLTSNIGWADDIIEDGVSGYLIHPKNHKEYVKRITHLIQNPSEMARVGIAAHRRVVDNFSHDRIAEKHIEFYRSILDTK